MSHSAADYADPLESSLEHLSLTDVGNTSNIEDEPSGFNPFTKLREIRIPKVT